MNSLYPLPPNVEPLGVGLHDGIPAERYHADPCVAPSLNSGTAKTIIEQTPAHAFLEHRRLGGKKKASTSEMILGSYVHGLLAGDVSDFEVGVFDDYKSKVAQTWRDGVEFAGKTPILEKNAIRAECIVKALRTKAARDLSTDPFTAGKPEVTAIWKETHHAGNLESEFWFRARFDRLILDPTFFGDVWDWKTTGNGVSADALERIIIDKGYHIQAAFYLRGLRALAPDWRGRLTFTLAFVETDAPFAVRRVPICEGFLSIGDRLVYQAIARWKQCLAGNDWPDDSGGTTLLTPPTWYLKKIEEAA